MEHYFDDKIQSDLDPQIWGDSYFTHNGPNKQSINFFAAHVGKVARYALPSVSHINKMINIEIQEPDQIMKESGFLKLFGKTL